MGLFTRKDPASGAQSSRPRPSVSSEAQATELRGRARRRLAGAVAMVLAAVIVLPMVLDSEPVPVADDIPIRVPDRNTPYQPQIADPAQVTALVDSEPAASPDIAVGAQDQIAAPPVLAPAETPRAEPRIVPPTVAANRQEPVRSPPEPRQEPARATPLTPRPESRSDDGARALALLEGRAGAAPASRPQAQPVKGNFVLQIAAYTTQADAQARSDKLHQAGVTNAFVEQTTVSGKQQYRLRVGPFPSRDAAQAAQARLRTLGYDNGFIAAQ